MAEPVKVRIVNAAVYEAACDEVRLLTTSWCQRYPGEEGLLITAMLHTVAGYLASSLESEDVSLEQMSHDLRDQILLAAVKFQREHECNGR